ncbi:hypothetical protein Novomoskovsk_80 [Bacillus phage Novomoskovsk]|uniref:Uncharacterized protein n=1 Tax=Bacillus phage Novomoskovsk TaxID=2736258 RepID=A0A6M9Z649_9CAUD|nr:hypothetical protein Novomoskovsk_80 [Bacillus phage Novomoskovsk]
MCNWLKQKGKIFRFLSVLFSKERTYETAKKETSKVKLCSRAEEAKLKS